MLAKDVADATEDKLEGPSPSIHTIYIGKRDIIFSNFPSQGLNGELKEYRT